MLERLQDSEELAGFAAYNLGIALLQDGRRGGGRLEQLDRAGQIDGERSRGARDPRQVEPRARARCYFEAAQFGPRAGRRSIACAWRGRSRTRRCLRAGWADASALNFERALVPWSILAEREPTDAAVQDAMLALPYAYSKLCVHGRAAVLYGRAVESFGKELAKVDASIASIEKGEFLEALVREEIRQDKDWVIRLRSLPDAPETFYLMTLMASHDFQTALQNYLDLEDMRKKLVAWQGEPRRVRRPDPGAAAYYEPLLPEIDEQFRKLDAQMRLRLEQRKSLDRRLQHMLIAPRPDYLADLGGAERGSAGSSALEARLGSASGAEQDALRSADRPPEGRAASGASETKYHRRLTDTHTHLRELNADVERLDAAVRRVRAHAPGGDAQLRRLRGADRGPARRGSRARSSGSTGCMTAQGEVLETVAIRELRMRRERLADYQNQARFAFADSYDRAAKAQAAAE